MYNGYTWPSSLADARLAAKRLVEAGGKNALRFAVREIAATGGMSWEGVTRILNAWINLVESSDEGECSCTPLSAACDACRVQALTVPLEEIY